MSNVRNGKVGAHVKSLFQKAGLKALLISRDTLGAIDGKELPGARDAEEGLPLVSGEYSGNPLVEGIGKIAGINPTEPVPVVESVRSAGDVAVEIKPFTVPTPVVEATEGSPKSEVDSADVHESDKPAVDYASQDVGFNTGAQGYPNPQTNAYNGTRSDDPVMAAINQTLVSQPKTNGDEQSLVTAEEFARQEDNEVSDNREEVSTAYVNVLDEMAKIRARHISELERIQGNLNASFDALINEYKSASQDIARKVEAARVADIDKIGKAVVDQQATLENLRVQGR